ncbi:unnamed protein product [Cylicostephanus goldi]|uniref:Pecanex-like protein n=1 Tax=Cylicostephanus goldi TaxID=71465 RepID=A0A3P6Q8Y5_CYLGO|nr:unnamed protein product [Cylicostephanus goldi]
MNYMGFALNFRILNLFFQILRCDFLEGSLPLEAADAIIFDVGLFHSLWGIRGCVAEYLDGGFGRLAWCVSHIISLTVSLPFAFVSRPRPYFLWPLLIQYFPLQLRIFFHSEFEQRKKC